MSFENLDPGADKESPFTIDPTAALNTSASRPKPQLKAARQDPKQAQNSGFIGRSQKKPDGELTDEEILALRKPSTEALKRATVLPGVDASIDLEPKTGKERMRQMMGSILTLGVTGGICLLLLGTVGAMIFGMIAQYEATNTVGSAKNFLQQGNASLAHRHLEPLVKAGTKDASVLALMGLCSNKLGDAQRALSEYDQAAKLAPKEPAHLCGKAEAYLKMDKPDDALAQANAAMALVPGFPDALRLRAAAYTKKGEHQKSLEDCEAYVKANKEAPADVYATKAEDLYAMKRYDDSAADYAQAVQIEPSNGAYWTARAHSLKDAKQYKEAVLSANGAIGVLGRQTDLLRLRAECHLLNSQFEESLQDYELVCQLSRKKDDYVKCADVAMGGKRFNLASFYYGKALETDRDDSKVRALLDQARQSAGLVPKTVTKKD